MAYSSAQNRIQYACMRIFLDHMPICQLQLCWPPTWKVTYAMVLFWTWIIKKMKWMAPPRVRASCQNQTTSLAKKSEFKNRQQQYRRKLSYSRQVQNLCFPIRGRTPTLPSTVKNSDKCAHGVFSWQNVLLWQLVALADQCMVPRLMDSRTLWFYFNMLNNISGVNMQA